MTTHKKAHVAGKILTEPKAGAAKSLAAIVLTQRGHTVSAKSGKAISRTVSTHRDALERLANR
jgi:hypothetical protein